tara:strand:+ start:7513 stop:7794 length:282 start_codon:yes stop_codon:yes gene_type:complete
MTNPNREIDATSNYLVCLRITSSEFTWSQDEEAVKDRLAELNSVEWKPWWKRLSDPIVNDLCKRIIAAGEKGKRITNHENRLNRLNRQRQQAR